MTAKQLLNFATEHSKDESLFSVLEILEGEQIEVARQLEISPEDKKLLRQYDDVCEKQQIIHLMQSQRLELLYKSGL